MPSRKPGVKAIISDIHSNFEALQATLKDIEKHKVEEIYCLGDIVGYGRTRASASTSS
jgi:predicted phosphodiesterase